MSMSYQYNLLEKTSLRLKENKCLRANRGTIRYKDCTVKTLRQVIKVKVNSFQIYAENYASKNMQNRQNTAANNLKKLDKSRLFDKSFEIISEKS